MSDLKTELGKARARVLAGEKLTIEEQRSLLEVIRKTRTVAAEAGEKARTTRGKGKTMSDEELDKELSDLGL